MRDLLEIVATVQRELAERKRSENAIYDDAIASLDELRAIENDETSAKTFLIDLVSRDYASEASATYNALEQVERVFSR